MKKSLLALAALSAIAGTAQAQSSVTLFGALDAGTYYVNGVSNSTNNGIGLLGSTIVSSNWGVKGTEDLGGGLKANFYAESGINPMNGTLSQSAGIPTVVKVAANDATKTATPTTLFDRGLYVGVQGNWGQLNLGNKINPVFASNGALVPVSGNSVGTNAAAALGFGNSTFTHNALTYTLPTMAGFNAELQWGFSNAVNDVAGGMISGSVLAGSADYTIGGLNLRAAGQKRWSNGSLLAANIGSGTSASALNAYGTGQTTYLVGAKYNFGTFTLGGGYVANQITSGAVTQVGTVNNSAFQVGAGYQATPAVLLGLSWVGNTAGSNLINAQARYAFSKRTQAYAQVGYVSNKTGLNGSGLGNMYALSGSNGGGYSSNIGLSTTPAVLLNNNQLGLGVGLIHTF